MYSGRQTFFIKKNSTLPKLKFEISEHMRMRYDITPEMLENVAVTFSMQDAESGNYRIANKGADLVVNEDFNTNYDDAKYALSYKFSIADTSKPGQFIGEFKVDFLGEDYCDRKITFPVTGKIDIVIQDSSTKTSVL